MFLHENAECRDDMTTVFLQFYGFAEWTCTERVVWRNGPIPECLPLVHGKHDFD